MKYTNHSPAAISRFGRLVEKFFNLMERIVPSGYEEDDGFYYGSEPSRVRHMVRFHTETYARRPLCYRTRRTATSLRSHQTLMHDITLQ